MPRQKLSEYRSKVLIAKTLNLTYTGWSVDADQPLREQIDGLGAGQFVVKVDQGVKGRFKKGLVLLNIDQSGLEQAVQELKAKGYHQFIIEPMVVHESSSERYLSLASQRSGVVLAYSASGGVDIESQADSVQSVLLSDETDWQQLSQATALTIEQLQALQQAFVDNYFVFLEINPYLVQDNQLQLLDLAIEVDDAAEFFVKSWQAADFRRAGTQQQTPQEHVVQELDAQSPASFNVSVLEPNGSIFLLLSGGGASVVVADEVYNQGYGKQLGNYGEYSGNPNTEETYTYTKAVLQLLLQSSAPRKVLFIGGAVANFTDIAKTFAGVMQAIEEVAQKLQEQQVKIFVRRGGPNQEVGLAKIQALLAKHNLLGAVHDPSTPLTAAVGEALQEVPRD